MRRSELRAGNDEKSPAANEPRAEPRRVHQRPAARHIATYTERTMNSTITELMRGSHTGARGFVGIDELRKQRREEDDRLRIRNLGHEPFQNTPRDARSCAHRRFGASGERANSMRSRETRGTPRRST
jgi:hypothetical protein